MRRGETNKKGGGTDSPATGLLQQQQPQETEWYEAGKVGGTGSDITLQGGGKDVGTGGKGRGVSTKAGGNKRGAKKGKGGKGDVEDTEEKREEEDNILEAAGILQVCSCLRLCVVVPVHCVLLVPF